MRTAPGCGEAHHAVLTRPGSFATSAPSSATGPFPNQGAALTERFQWHSLRLGARTAVPIVYNFSLNSLAQIIPWSQYELTDIHHLRTDLRQDPSCEARTTGGFGVRLEAGISYTFWRTATVAVGYRYWHLESGEGDITAQGLTSDTVEPFHGAVPRRHGPTIGLTYRF